VKHPQNVLTSNFVFYALVCFHHTAEVILDSKRCQKFYVAPVANRDEVRNRTRAGLVKILWCARVTTAIRIPNKVLTQN